jgi:hypothetical protein
MPTVRPTLLRAMGLADVEKHPVPEAEVRACGLESITNLVVRRARMAPENGAAQRAR